VAGANDPIVPNEEVVGQMQVARTAREPIGQIAQIALVPTDPTETSGKSAHAAVFGAV